MPMNPIKQFQSLYFNYIEAVDLQVMDDKSIRPNAEKYDGSYRAGTYICNDVLDQAVVIVDKLWDLANRYTEGEVKSLTFSRDVFLELRAEYTDAYDRLNVLCMDVNHGNYNRELYLPTFDSVGQYPPLLKRAYAPINSDEVYYSFRPSVNTRRCLKDMLEIIKSAAYRVKDMNPDYLYTRYNGEVDNYQTEYVSHTNQLVGLLTAMCEGVEGVYNDTTRRFNVVKRGLKSAIKNYNLFDMKSETLTDYLGNEIVANEALVITYPSDYEGEYIHRDDAFETYAYTQRGEHEIIVPNDESHYYVDVVGGTTAHSEECEDELRYLQGGEYEGEYCWEDDAIYCEDDGQYYHTDDEGTYVFWNERREEYSTSPASGGLHGYHQGFRRDYTDSSTKYTIGFEVEKEDTYVVESYDLDDVDETGWCREEDSSLDDGFELVSPTYDLMSSMLDDAINDSRLLQAHINAGHSRSCGGHINLGQRGLTGSEFFDTIQGFVPLFLTIWRHRLGNQYSQIKRKPHDYKNAGKYSAIHVKGSYIEIRLPSAVRHVNNLLWRRDLMRIVCNNQGLKPLQVITQMLSPKSELGSHLRKIYSDEQMFKIVSIYSQFADDLYGSFNFTSDGVGVFAKSVVRRLKNRNVDPQQIVSYSYDAIDRLSNAFGSSYSNEVKATKNSLSKLIEVNA